MNPHIGALVRVLEKGSDWDVAGEKISVSRTSRTAGGVYEKVRNIVEYEEEHLLRRNAIRRIVARRRVADDGEGEVSRGETILKELIWAKYLPNRRVPVQKAKALDAVLRKYDRLFDTIDAQSSTAVDTHEWLLDVLSTELEYVLEPPRSSEALASMMFDTMRAAIAWDDDVRLDAPQRDMLLYLAIHRALLKSNAATLRYRALMLYVPTWHRPTVAVANDTAKRLPTLIVAIESHLRHPYADQLFRLMRRYAMVFWTMEDVAREHPDRAEAIFADAEQWKRKVSSAAAARYKRFHTRAYRTVGRAVLFLFITKMLLALILELPYDAYVLGGIVWEALAINIVFHPLLLTIIGVTVRVPIRRNTTRIVELSEGVLAGDSAPWDVVFRVKRPWARGVLGTVFSTLYALTFVVSYGLIAWFLTSVLNFNILSTALFLFFFSLVTFFGIKIRQSVRELLVVSRQGGLIGTLFDFFLLPVVRVGRWISLQSPKVNVFIFFLDFIVEAPFKLAIEAVEGWVAFTREKKEEL